MALARVVIPILFGLILLGGDAVAQSNERVHQIAAKALTLARQIEHTDVKARLLPRVAIPYCRNHEEAKAQEIFDEAKKYASGKDRAHLLGLIAYYQADAGLHEDALTTLAQLKTDDEDARDWHDYYSMFVADFIANQSDLNTARKVCASIDSVERRSYALAKISVAAFRSGDSDSAIELAREAVVWAKKNTAMPYGQSLPEVEGVVRALCRGGMRQVAQDIVTPLVANAKSAQDWEAIMDMQAACANVSGVGHSGLEYLRLSRDWYTQDSYYCELASAQANLGSVDKARETLSFISDSGRYRNAADSVARSLLSEGRISDAVEIIDTTDKRIFYWDSEDKIYLDAAKAYFEKGEIDRGKALLRRTRDNMGTEIPEHKFGGLRELGSTFGELKMEDEFEAWISEVDWSGAQVTALIGLANGILDREQKSK